MKIDTAVWLLRGAAPTCAGQIWPPRLVNPRIEFGFINPKRIVEAKNGGLVHKPA